MGLSNTCSYDVDDIIGRVDRFGYQNFCSPGPQLMAHMNYRGATERERTGINAIPFLNSYLKSLPFNSVCQKKKKKAYLLTHTQKSELGDSKQIIF